MERVFGNPSFNYLDCRKIQVFNYLLSQELPVKRLYYNSLESTDDVFDQIFLNQKRKWRFASNLGNELEQIGINKVEMPFIQFSDIKDQLIAILKSKGVFVWLNSQKLIHRDGMDPDSNHSMLIVNYMGDNNFKMDDVPLCTDIVYNLTNLEHGEKLIHGYENFITYFDLESFIWTEHIAQEINKRAKIYLDEFTDSFTFYEKLARYFQESEEVDSELAEWLPFIDDALSIIAGSRYLLSQFFTESSWPQIYADLYLELAKRLESLKIGIAKSSITGKR